MIYLINTKFNRRIIHCSLIWLLFITTSTFCFADINRYRVILVGGKNVNSCKIFWDNIKEDKFGVHLWTQFPPYDTSKKYRLVFNLKNQTWALDEFPTLTKPIEPESKFEIISKCIPDIRTVAKYDFPIFRNSNTTGGLSSVYIPEFQWLNPTTALMMVSQSSSIHDFIWLKPIESGQSLYHSVSYLRYNKKSNKVQILAQIVTEYDKITNTDEVVLVRGSSLPEAVSNDSIVKDYERLLEEKKWPTPPKWSQW